LLGGVPAAAVLLLALSVCKMGTMPWNDLFDTIVAVAEVLDRQS
jgi:hypothetical protein